MMKLMYIVTDCCTERVVYRVFEQGFNVVDFLTPIYQFKHKKAIFDVQNDECDLLSFFVIICELELGSCVSESMPHQSIGIQACLDS